MNDEFHYYVTYLAAARAGFVPDDAWVLAYASQYVDDNDEETTVQWSDPAYVGTVSQTMNILQPEQTLARIYPLFHFIPGDPDAVTARRKDGRTDPGTTTPNSLNAQKILREALATNDVYRIGVAVHAYADTWAHQNFTGDFDDFNALANGAASLLPGIGHAQAGYQPDIPGLVWHDSRLAADDGTVDNTKRYVEAAQFLLRHLCPLRRALDEATLEAECTALGADLAAIFTRYDPEGGRDERIADYRTLAGQAAYGHQGLPAYDSTVWRNNAIASLANDGRLPAEWRWQHPDTYKETHWYRFQEAIKGHIDDAERVLKGAALAPVA